MKIKLQLSYNERQALDVILSNTGKPIKAEEIALSQLTIFQLGLPDNLREAIILELDEVQSRLYKNKSNDYTFLFKWKHEVIEQ